MIGLDVRVDVSLDAQEKQAALRHVQSHLSDDLLKALFEELFTHWADAALASLSLRQLLV